MFHIPLAVKTVMHPLTMVTLYAAAMPWGDPGVVRVVLGTENDAAIAQPDAAAVDYLERCAERVTQYLDGGDIDLTLEPLSFSHETVFTRTVLEAAKTVPRGSVVTYAMLAVLAGHTGAARAVAMVMRRNPCPLFVPCHRIVAADSIGGFMGELSGPVIELKKRLLALEGYTA